MRTLIILDVLVLVAGQEIDCEITFLCFAPRCRFTLYESTVTTLFLECAVNNTKTLSTSLATDDFIRQYKLFISLRSWKVVLTWNKALLWSNPVIPRGGWLFVFTISWQQPPLVCSLLFACVHDCEGAHLYLKVNVSLGVRACVCASLPVLVCFLWELGEWECVSVSDSVRELTNLKLLWISLQHWLPLATLCLCCVCRLQGLLILELFFFQLQSLTDLACSKGLNHLKLSLLLPLHPVFTLPLSTHAHTQCILPFVFFHDSSAAWHTVYLHLSRCYLHSNWFSLLSMNSACKMLKKP